MTYNVFGGSLYLAQSQSHEHIKECCLLWPVMHTLTVLCNFFAIFNIHASVLFFPVQSYCHILYRYTTCPEKKVPLDFFAVTLPNPNRSSKFFYHHTQQ